MRIEILFLRFKGLNRLFETTRSPCTNVSKQTMQNIMMMPVEFSLENTGWKFSDTLNEFESFNWSKHNFGEIHISQGSDWAFHSLPHHSLLLALNGIYQVLMSRAVGVCWPNPHSFYHHFICIVQSWYMHVHKKRTCKFVPGFWEAVYSQFFFYYTGWWAKTSCHLVFWYSNELHSSYVILKC